MKRKVCGAMALVMAVLFMSCAIAEQTVQLPESKYCLTIPDEMEYDGPGTGSDDAAFAYVSTKLNLEIDFFLNTNQGGATLQAVAEILRQKDDDIAIYRISGIEMIVYRVTDTDNRKGIGYVFLDGSHIQEVVFWYGTQAAADLTETIIQSITYKD